MLAVSSIKAKPGEIHGTKRPDVPTAHPRLTETQKCLIGLIMFPLVRPSSGDTMPLKGANLMWRHRGCRDEKAFCLLCGSLWTVWVRHRTTPWNRNANRESDNYSFYGKQINLKSICWIVSSTLPLEEHDVRCSQLSLVSLLVVKSQNGEGKNVELKASKRECSNHAVTHGNSSY